MNISDGGRDAPLTPRSRRMFIAFCVTLGVVGLVLLIIVR
jgi:hypothetical protein